LQGNRISSLDELARLRACSSLRSLWLANADGSAANPGAAAGSSSFARARSLAALVSLAHRWSHGACARAVCDELAYRSTLLKLLPALQSLDGVRVRVAREVFGAADANAHAAPARPAGPDTAALIASLSNVQPWLPRTLDRGRTCSRAAC
jgi:hypothetical protein